MTTQVRQQEPPKLFLKFVGSLAAGLTVWWMAGRLALQNFSTDDFVNPAAKFDSQSVTDIAASLPPDEDDFIMSAWDYVASNIKYQGYASNLYFIGDTIKCVACRTPEATLKIGRGNCVSMSSILASILRNRLPPDRVFMSVGELRLNGTGGHSWCIVQRSDSKWYLLESTQPPKAWVPMETLSYIYKPSAYFNDELFYCYDEQICQIKVKGCDCQKILLEFT